MNSTRWFFGKIDGRSGSASRVFSRPFFPIPEIEAKARSRASRQGAVVIGSFRCGEVAATCSVASLAAVADESWAASRRQITKPSPAARTVRSLIGTPKG